MTVYRAGVPEEFSNPVGRPPASSALSDALRPSLVFRRWRQLFPRRRLVGLVHVAFDRVERLNTPPKGQPFVVQGKPYASDEEFIQDLCEELRERLLRHLEETSKALV